jgi:hypothetical protein
MVKVVSEVLTGLCSRPTGRFAGGITVAVFAHLFNSSFIISSQAVFAVQQIAPVIQVMTVRACLDK